MANHPKAEIIRSVVKDMATCYCGKRVSWNREEVYPLVREIQRLRAELAMSRQGMKVILVLLLAGVAMAQPKVPVYDGVAAWQTGKTDKWGPFLCVGTQGSDLHCPRVPPKGWEIDINPDTGQWDECHSGDCRPIPNQYPTMCLNPTTHVWRKWKPTASPTSREYVNGWYNECVKPLTAQDLEPRICCVQRGAHTLPTDPFGEKSYTQHGEGDGRPVWPDGRPMEAGGGPPPAQTYGEGCPLFCPGVTWHDPPCLPGEDTVTVAGGGSTCKKQQYAGGTGDSDETICGHSHCTDMEIWIEEQHQEWIKEPHPKPKPGLFTGDFSFITTGSLSLWGDGKCLPPFYFRKGRCEYSLSVEGAYPRLSLDYSTSARGLPTVTLYYVIEPAWGSAESIARWIETGER